MNKIFMPLKKLSKTKLSVLIFSFSILCLTLAFFLSGLTWKQIVDAFTTKSAGSTLTVSDWNGLLGDFVKKSGDTMSGSLTVNGDVSAISFHAANAFYAAHGYCIGSSCITSWPGNHFGGMFSSGNPANSFVNPYTGGYSCPPGYAAHLIFKDTGHNAEYSNLYICYKS